MGGHLSYFITTENVEKSYPELEPLYREHYEEMSARLRGMGQEVSPYAPRFDEYFKAANGGWLTTYVLRCDGAAVGYCNVYITNDMHNHDLIAQEDALFVTRAHRNGVGKQFVRMMLDALKARGVKKVSVSARTDLRVANLWRRMGFKDVAVQMEYIF